jgi:hypothetical protein
MTRRRSPSFVAGFVSVGTVKHVSEGAKHAIHIAFGGSCSMQGVRPRAVLPLALVPAQLGSKLYSDVGKVAPSHAVVMIPRLRPGGAQCEVKTTAHENDPPLLTELEGGPSP